MPLDIADILINLVITILLYGVGPVFFLLFRKHPVSLSTLKKFNITYTVAIALFYAVCNSLANERINFAPALLWGYVYYKICKAQFKKRGLLVVSNTETTPQEEAPLPPVHQDVSESPEAEPTPIVCTYTSDFKIKSPDPLPTPTDNSIPRQSGQNRARLVTIALAVLCTLSIGGNIYQATHSKAQINEIAELQSELDKEKKSVKSLQTGKEQLAKEVKSLKDELAELEDYNDFATEYAIAGLFMYDSIGFIVPGSNYYHRYDCPVFHNADSYWAHNIEYCSGQGYGKCPVCWED